MHSGMCVGHKVAAALVWVGAINWGLVGVFKYNLVASLFGAGSSVERVIYIIVGVSALFMLLMCKCSGCCQGGACGMGKGDKKM